MMNVKRMVLLGLALVFTWGTGAGAAENSLKGYMFGDYYYVASGANKKQNGFQFRRIYVTYDLKWNDQFSGRLRFEAKDGGFGSGKSMDPSVKHAYLRYKKNGRALYMGLSGTPTWSVTEGLWGYRSIEKTLMDLNKMSGSADMGVAFQGKLDEAGKVNAHLMLGNGSGTSAESDNHKKIYGQLHLKPTKAFQVVVYGDWESRPADQDRMTFAGLLGFSGSSARVGLEGAVQVRKNQAAGADIQVRGLSLFAAGKLNEKTGVFARADFYDPNNKAGGDREYLILGGIDVEVAKDIHVMPNIVSTVCQAAGVNTEVMPRVTVFYKF
ncbi:MAG: hypothetical protein O2954_08000 [bacterium]|nr:hypothetical protein [bacterium]